jgi:hypothetical protein
VSNLVPLCEACHRSAHSGTLDIAGYAATTDGVVLQVTTATGAGTKN